ncbi:MAG: DUF362 domain-containing protein [Chloroflexi bacterium]|nr:DUF362 domain-containing protein [Chloroflexota bacterium]
MRAKVALADCADYDLDRVYAAVKCSLEEIGGMEAFVRPGQRVLLQVNLISPRPAEDAVCTHPSIVRAACRLVGEAGGIPSVGGSAGGSAYHRTRRVLQVSGIAAAAAEEGVEVLDYDEMDGQDVSSDGAVMQSIHIAKPVLDTDVLITLPKMKTHSVTLLTGAVKNHLGTLPGARKAELHRRFPAPEQFSQALVDIYAAATPHLTIMDAVDGMDGNGPTAGRVRHVGLVASSADSVALDTVMCAVCGIDPKWVFTGIAAHKRGLGVGSLEEIEVVGTPLDAARGRVRPFAYPMTYRLFAHSWVPEGGRRIAGQYLGGSPSPIVISSKCNGCQTCIRSCPAQAMAMVNNKASIEQKKCISCFCCHELCTQQAIGIKVPFLWHLFRA